MDQLHPQGLVLDLRVMRFTMELGALPHGGTGHGTASKVKEP